MLHILHIKYYNTLLCVLLLEEPEYIHGISLSNFLPQLSPIPPAAHHRPEPASVSLPVPSCWVLPANMDCRTHITLLTKLEDELQLYSIMFDHYFSRLVWMSHGGVILFSLM